MSSSENHSPTGISISDLINLLLQKKITILFVTFFSAMISVGTSLYLPNVYTSQSIIAPTVIDNSISNSLGGYSSIAGLVGINIPNKSQNKSDEAIERIKSYDFFVEEFIPNIKFQDLVAYKRWDSASNEIIYKEKIYKNNKWVISKKLGIPSIPSEQEAFKVYKKLLNIVEDPQSTFVTIEISHVSPYIAKEWLELIINNINNYMREIDKEIAKNSVDFLQATAKETSISQIKTVISKLIENHVQTLTLVESNEYYIFRPISSPIVPEEKSGPLRALICIFGTMLGFLLSIFSIFFLHTYKSKKINIL